MECLTKCCGSECVTKKRCRLGPESIRASVCLQAWNRLEPLETILEEEENFFVKMIETSSENAFENVRISRSALRNLLIIRLFFGNTDCEMISISYRFLPKTDRNRPKPIEQIGSVFIKNPKPTEADRNRLCQY